MTLREFIRPESGRVPALSRFTIDVERSHEDCALDETHRVVCIDLQKQATTTVDGHQRVLHVGTEMECYAYILRTAGAFREVLRVAVVPVPEEIREMSKAFDHAATRVVVR